MRHPVQNLMAECAYTGREPTTAELDELQLEPADRALVARASREAAFQYAGGDRGVAREHALQRSLEIVAQLPEEQRSATYLRDPNEGTENLTPPELADRIPDYARTPN